MSDENKYSISGARDEYRESDKSILRSLISLRDVVLIVGGVLLLNMIGIVDVPYINRLAELPYRDVMATILTGAIGGYVVAWSKTKEVLEDRYEKDWVWLEIEDMYGDYSGVAKTDPDTFRKDDNIIKWVERDYREATDDYIFQEVDKDNPMPNVRRDGTFVPNRDYNLVRLVDIDYNEEGDKVIVLEDVDDYPAEINDDMVIANKDHLQYEIGTMQDDADFGRKAKLTIKSRLKHYVNRLSAQLSVMHQHAVNEGVSDPEELYAESIEGYEPLEIDVDDLEPDKSYTEKLAENSAENIIQEVNQGDSNE